MKSVVRFLSSLFENSLFDNLPVLFTFSEVNRLAEEYVMRARKSGIKIPKRSREETDTPSAETNRRPGQYSEVCFPYIFPALTTSLTNIIGPANRILHITFQLIQNCTLFRAYLAVSIRNVPRVSGSLPKCLPKPKSKPCYIFQQPTLWSSL